VGKRGCGDAHGGRRQVGRLRFIRGRIGVNSEGNGIKKGKS